MVVATFTTLHTLNYGTMVATMVMVTVVKFVGFDEGKLLMDLVVK